MSEELTLNQRELIAMRAGFGSSDADVSLGDWGYVDKAIACYFDINPKEREGFEDPMGMIAFKAAQLKNLVEVVDDRS